MDYIQQLVNSDKNRKLRNFMLYDFYQNDTEAIKAYQLQYMLGSTIDNVQEWIYVNNKPELLAEYSGGIGLFSKETASIMPKYHRDVTNKALSNICTVYHTGIDRYLTNPDGSINEEQTKLLNDIYKKASVNLLQREWYRQAKLFNIVEVKAVWRKKTERLEFDIWTPNFFTVIENNESYLYKDGIVFDLTATINGEEKDVKEVWTDTEHYLLEFKETRKINRNEVDIFEEVEGSRMSNPYKTIPSQELRFKIGQDYYGIGMFDLVEDNIWHDIRSNNHFFVEMFQGLGFMYGVNVGKSGSIPIQPFSIFTVEEAPANKGTAKIESVSPNAPLSDLRESEKSNVEQILMMKGLSSQAATTSNQNAPGISKALDQDELEMQKQEDQLILMDFEEKFYQKVRTVYNYHSDIKLDEKLTFVCQFNKKETALSVNDMINKWKFEINDIGVKTPVDYLTDENPDMTIKEAEAIVAEIRAKRIADGDIVLQGDGQGNPRVNQTFGQ